MLLVGFALLTIVAGHSPGQLQPSLSVEEMKALKLDPTEALISKLQLHAKELREAQPDQTPADCSGKKGDDLGRCCIQSGKAEGKPVRGCSPGFHLRDEFVEKKVKDVRRAKVVEEKSKALEKGRVDVSFAPAA